MKTIRLIMKLAALALLALALITNNFLPITYLIGIGVVLVILLLICWNRKVLQIVIVLLILLTSGGLLYIENAASRLINYNPNQVNSVSFFVLKDSSITTIKKALDKNISTSSIAEEETTALIQQKLEAKGYKQKLSLFQGIQSGIQDLYDGKIDVLVIDQAYLSSIMEYDAEFTNNTKVIWSIENTTNADTASSAVKVATEPFIVFISGIDDFGPVSIVSRSDVNIVMVVNPKTRTIQTVSIPRDAYVGLGCKKGAPLDKLTHAGMFGISCSISTVENLLGIKVNYYARANFTTVVSVVGTLGGVTVYSEYAFDSYYMHFNKGMIKLNQQSALAFARERHAFASGDEQRGKNQQELIKGMFAKLTSLSTLTKIDGIISATSKSIDTNMSTNELSKLIKKQLDSNKPWEITTSNLSGVGDMKPTYSMGSRLLYVMHPDAASLAQIKQNISDFMIVAE